MKIRQGFVSNSSSSSFIAIVVKYPIDLLTGDLADKLDTFGYSILADLEDGWTDKNTMAVGDIIDNNDDYGPMVMWDVRELNEIWDDISSKMGVEGERLVISGTRMC